MGLAKADTDNGLAAKAADASERSSSDSESLQKEIQELRTNQPVSFAVSLASCS
jgi:hypothetical protein